MSAKEFSLTRNERYLKLWDLILEQDREMAEVLDDYRRSNAIWKIMRIQKRGWFSDA
jgi:hypothetical protein